MGTICLGDRTAQRQAHEPVEDLKVYNEPIRSPQDRTVQVGVTEHPRGPATSTAYVELPGGPASVLEAGGTVFMTYDPGVTTWGAMALLVAADPASAAILEMIVLVLAPMPAGLVGADLWSDLIGVPGAMFRYNPANGRWEGWDGAIVGGAAMLAAMQAIQANTSPDNRSGGVTHSLTAALVDHSLGVSGRTFRVLGLTGAASVRLVNGGVPYPTLPAAALDVYPLDYLDFDFTDVLLSCAAQPGLVISVYAGWRV